MSPVSVFDVAAYILKKHGRMSTMKLQKLVYYSQAWSLVWDKRPLFKEEIQAWKEGPVVKPLWSAHKGSYYVEPGGIDGKPSNLDKSQRDTVDAILRDYGKFDGLTLSNWTHSEEPWIKTRKGLDPDDSCDWVISHKHMRDFYGSL